MNDPGFHEEDLANASREEIMSALFANMVLQQTNMALMFLGKVPHPETGETIQDVESAKIFIDQLEMLEFKTKGNLDKQEEGLLKQSLTALRMSFVEAVEENSGGPSQEQCVPGSNPESTQGQSAAVESSDAKTVTPDDESRKRFSKKY